MLGVKTYALTDGFYAAYMLRFDLEKILGCRIPLTMLTDSESLFRVIIKSSITTEKKLMVDVRAAREAYHKVEIGDVGWIRSTENLVDGLKKFAKCKALTACLESRIITTSVEQWVIRGEFQR